MTNEMGSRSQLTTTVGDHYIIYTTGLELHNTTRELSGVYECEVDNGLERDVKSACVRVEGQFVWNLLLHLWCLVHIGICGPDSEVHTSHLSIFSPLTSSSSPFHNSFPSPFLLHSTGLPLPLSFHPAILIADDNYTLTCDIIYNFPTATITWRRTDATPLPPREIFHDLLGGS